MNSNLKEKRNMKKKISKYLRGCALAAFLLLPAIGFARDNVFNFDGDEAQSYGFSDTKNKLNSLANMAFYGMYLVGGVMLTGGAIKLKQGDVPGFAKMAAALAESAISTSSVCRRGFLLFR